MDAGLNEELLNSHEAAYESFTTRGWHPRSAVLPQRVMINRLEDIGVRTDEVEHVILTHMHADHTGSLRLFRHARISVQPEEYQHAFSGNTSAAWIESDYN